MQPKSLPLECEQDLVTRFLQKACISQSCGINRTMASSLLLLWDCPLGKQLPCGEGDQATHGEVEEGELRPPTHSLHRESEQSRKWILLVQFSLQVPAAPADRGSRPHEKSQARDTVLHCSQTPGDEKVLSSLEPLGLGVILSATPGNYHAKVYPLKLIPALSPMCAATSVMLLNLSYYTGTATAPCVKPSAQCWADEKGLKQKLQLR